ncbi:MAG: Tol-Pal system protein TolB [Betaproteobacteria bacterium]|nr:MAG: Tol-Pal system protein TolB [Betaproteobacteria bacterium]
MTFAKRNLLALIIFLVATIPRPTPAQVSVEVVGGEGSRISIAVLSFHGDETVDEEQRIGQIISADLMRSSAIRVVEASGLGAGFNDQVDYDYFSSAGTDMVVIGNVSERDGKIEAQYALVDVARRKRLVEEAVTEDKPASRMLAHRIADRVHLLVSGYSGAYATKICYVARDGHSSKIFISDADGYNRQLVYATDSPIMSPQWSPDGTRLAYVSFERQRPRIYVHNIASGSREVVSKFRGTNSAPAWSPDGKKLAVTLSKDGGSQIYLIDADGGNAKRLSDSRSRDTEPSFSPDGRHILFTSDRGGSPQIYRIPVDVRGRAQRVTFDGRYNTSPKYAADGQWFAYVRMENGRFSIAAQNMANGEIRYLTSGRDDRSPAFSPNGKAILYATEVKGRGALGAISIDGSTRWGIATYSHDIRGVAWGPYESHRVEASQ